MGRQKIKLGATIEKILNIIIVIAGEFILTGLVFKALNWANETSVPDLTDLKDKIKTQLPAIKQQPITEPHEQQTPQSSCQASQACKDAYWGLISFSYQKLKQTPVYKQWRSEQFDCQFGKCGICGKPMDRNYTHLDHIESRYSCGTNYSDNLVLTHPECNKNKGANNGNRPSWIKDNPYSDEFDRKAWEILQTEHKSYPDKVPDIMIKPPTR